MRNAATELRTKPSNGLLAGYLLRAFARGGDISRETDRSSHRKYGATQLSGAPSPIPARRIVDLNERVRRLSTLLSAVSGPGNDLRIDLCADPAPLHCAPERIDLALIEAVAHMRGLLAGPGTIVLRTRCLHHHAVLAIGAREDGAAAFRFGAPRVPPRPLPSSLFGAARSLAVEAHGRLRFRAPAVLILRLPTVLKLAGDKRPDASVPTLPRQTKEKTREDRQPVAV